MQRRISLAALLLIVVICYHKRGLVFHPSALSEVGSCRRIDVTVNGHRGFLFLADHPRTWVWFAPTIFSEGIPNQRHEWIFSQLLAHGISVAGVDVGESYGSPDGQEVFQSFYELVTGRYGLSKKPCLLPQSRGGLMLYGWAEHHANEVACIAGIYPVVNLSSWPPADHFPAAAYAYHMTSAQFSEERTPMSPIADLTPLAAARVPILHLHGLADHVVPADQNSLLLQKRYSALGGNMTVISIPGKGHEEVDEFFHSNSLVDFLGANISH